MALALLTKGLLGIAILSVGYTLYLVLARKLTWAIVSRHALVFGGGILLACPWFFAMELADPGYLYYYFVERHFLGYATATQQHGGEPWYYYLPILLFGSMPWTPYALVWATRLRWKRSEVSLLEAKPDLLLLCWFCGGLLFLSLAGSKLLTYALPLFPMLAIAAGVAIRQFHAAALAPAIQRTVAWNFRVLSAAGCVGPMATLAVLHHFAHMPAPMAAWWVALLAASMTAIGLVLFQRGRVLPAFSCGTLWVAGMFVMLTTWPLQTLTKAHSQYELAQRINELTEQVDRLVLVGEQPASVIFYLRPDIREHLRGDGVVSMSWSQDDWSRHLPPGSLLAVSDRAWKDSAQQMPLPAAYQGERLGRFQILRENSPPHTASHPEGGLHR
jgi:4-amino-4-deoxy-L-arabinose transferase-like glycosyltransferase